MTTARRTALVTGASRGIGAAIACALARDGLDVIVNYVANETAAHDVAGRVRALGAKATVARFDVRDHDETRRKLGELLAECTIDVLVNNAGVVADGPFPSMNAEAWEKVTRTSIDGFFNVTQPLVMPMVRRKWGRIVTLSSVSGVIGNRGQVNYSAAKAALIGATKSLAQELAKRKITVNAVAPGLVETEMVAGAPVDEILKHIPMQRMGKPEEVAELVAFLASDKAAYITGQVITIAGGLG
jgi:3-oxoacyl-[acyl-carrier protein] reductase